MASDVGLIGLGVMGQSLALNLANHGFSVAAHTLEKAKADEFTKTRAAGKSIKVFDTIKELIKELDPPRKIILLVPAGATVEQLIGELVPLADRGDILIDSGNSFFRDTEKRSRTLEGKGLHFIGMGISGGEQGALKGPSIMPGGDENAVTQIMPILRKIAAQEPEPCVAYMGAGGAGHFVKMVHNGIEYGEMQLIAEIYDIAKRAFHFSNDDLHLFFKSLRNTKLSSYLIEITESIFLKKEGERYLIDLILDVARSKGTGAWTVQEGLNLGTPIPSIAAAQACRELSAHLEERNYFSRVAKAAIQENKVEQSRGENRKGGRSDTLLASAMIAGKILIYAQGMHMLHAASEEYGFNLDLAVIAKIWRGGCIIRSAILNDIAAAFDQKNITHLMQAPEFAKLLNENLQNLRQAVSLAALCGVPVASLSSALWYWDSLCAKSLPANLIQAQRDFFGAHTYERIDRPGTFHTKWE